MSTSEQLAPPAQSRTTMAIAICRIDRLTPNRGVAALVHGTAVAVFLLDDGSLHAVDNIDPVSGASILSRGLIGDVDGLATVASPMYKQRFELSTGRCLDLADVAIGVHDAFVDDGWIHVRLGVPTWSTRSS